MNATQEIRNITNKQVEQKGVDFGYAAAAGILSVVGGGALERLKELSPRDYDFFMGVLRDSAE